MQSGCVSRVVVVRTLKGNIPVTKLRIRVEQVVASVMQLVKQNGLSDTEGL
jgi:hypothetical protein